MNPAEGAMSFTRAQPREAPGLQVAPMVDCVFLLICFFTFTNQLIQSQKDPAVELPVMASPLAATELPAEITVNLRRGGAVTVGGATVSLGDLAALLAASARRAEAERQPVRVVVRADRGLAFARLDDVLDVCRKAGLPMVVFRAEGEY
jgi:biopolymer transport protein ExbD